MPLPACCLRLLITSTFLLARPHIHIEKEKGFIYICTVIIERIVNVHFV